MGELLLVVITLNFDTRTLFKNGRFRNLEEEGKY